MNKFNNTNVNKNVVLANKQIRAETLRVSDEDGTQLGIISTKEALELAYSKDKDLILITDRSDPPVAKIGNLNKYNYELKKRKKEQEKNARASVQEVKEIKFRIGIGEHDLDIKIKQVRKFLDKNAKVKITVQLRGREIGRGKDAVAYFTDIFDDRLDNFKYLQPLKLAGNRITGVIINV